MNNTARAKHKSYIMRSLYTVHTRNAGGVKEMNSKTKAATFAAVSCGIPLVIIPGVCSFPITALAGITAGLVFIGMQRVDA